MPLLAGPGFVLRPFRVEDVPADRDTMEHPSSAKWLNALPEGDDASIVAQCESDREAGKMLLLTIADSEDDRYLGGIVLFRREHDVGEIAYVVAPAERGRGLAPSAVRALGEWAFAELGLQRLQLRIDPDNEASHRVAERAGYRREGTMRSAIVVRGRRTDAVMYGRLPDDP